MGARIAAHITTAGVPVILLDIVSDGNKNRNAIAEGAVEMLLHSNPASFMHQRNEKLITPGNIEDHFDFLSECDWIIEAVIEREDIKHDTYKKIESVRRSGSIVSSNTSTIPLKTLIQGMPETFAQDFLIAHFFNPPPRRWRCDFYSLLRREKKTYALATQCIGGGQGIATILEAM